MLTNNPAGPRDMKHNVADILHASLQRTLRGEKSHGTSPPNPLISDTSNPDCRPTVAHANSTLSPSPGQKD